MKKSRHRSSFLSRSGRNTTHLHRDTLNRCQLSFESLEDRRMLAVFSVDNLNDSGTGSLRQAIIDSNSSTSTPDEIVFQTGLTGTIDLGSQLPTITDDLTITGPGADQLTLDAGSGADNTSGTGDGFRIFNIDDGDGGTQIDVMLSGLTLTGGDTAAGADDGSGDSGESGGAIFSRENLTLVDSTVTGNATGQGGSAEFRYDYYGGYEYGFAGPGGSGAGIFSSGGSLSVIRSTISNNQTGVGGISNGIQYPGGSGGGISHSGGDFTIVSSTVSNNSASGGDGGGISHGNGTLSITSSTVSGNSSGQSGGGVALSGGSLIAQGTTITNNSTASYYGLGGGGIRAAYGNAILSNTIVSANVAAGAPDNLSGTGFSGNFNLLGAGETTGGSQDRTGINDPLLGPLADNGGPTQTHAIILGSPALNGGDPSIASGTDQRGVGFSRVQLGQLDIGAFELQLLTLLVDTTSDESNGDFSPGNLSLREAVELANAIPGADTITFDPNVFSGGVGSLIRLTSGELEISGMLVIDASTATDVVITGDASGDDALLPGFLTDVAASGDALLDDNSRVLNFSSTTGDLTLEGLTLTGGRTTGDNDSGEDSTYSGGGIRFASDGTLTLVSSTVSGNSTAGGGADGGGIFTYYGAVTLTGSTISGNSTTGPGSNVNSYGGGLYSARGDVSVTSSTISGNSSRGDGGGIFAAYLMLTLTNSTISGNSSGYSGGGISSGGELVIRSSTVFDNQSPNGEGGGVYHLSGPITIENSIIAGNSDDGTAPNLRPDPNSTLDVTFSLIGDNRGSSLTSSPAADASGNLIGSLGNPLEPLLGPLADNGGPTQTHALQPGSPAIDAGGTTTLTTDQRGRARVVGGSVDIGAFELLAIEVNSTADTDDDDPDNGTTTLREAIGITNSLEDIDAITFDPGVFGTLQTIHLASQLPTVTNELTITGPGADLLTLDAGGGTDGVIGNGDGFRILNIDNSDSSDILDVAISGLTLTGGDASGDGGAIRTAESLTLTDSIVIGNFSGDDGGGIFNVSEATLAVIDSTITGNSANDDGGGISNYGTTHVLRSAISGNQTTGGNNNSGGAGILTRGSGELTVTDSTLSNNSADGIGGGIFSFGGLTSVIGSTISGNQSGDRGGGIFTVGGDVTLANSTVSGNSSSATGGGIYTFGAGNFGASGDVMLTSTIVANSEGGADLATNTGSFSGSFNLIEDSSGSLLSGANNLTSVDPLLGPLDDNGGPTQTHAIILGSPALNGGDPSITSGTDQRGVGFNRVQLGRLDIGAFELQDTLPAAGLQVGTTNDEIDDDFSETGLSLREAILFANAFDGADVITFSSLFDSAQVIALNAELPKITSSVTITGPGADLLTIDAGNGADDTFGTGDGFRIFDIDDGNIMVGTRLTLAGLTLTGGDSPSDGGAIRTSEQLEVRDSIIINNSARRGGGIFVEDRDVGPIDSPVDVFLPTVDLFDSTLSGNTATSHGGGIFSEDLVRVTRSTVSGNSSVGDGGGIYHTRTRATLRESTVSSNTSGSLGGGVAAFGILEIINSTVSGNSSGYSGGGISSGRELVVRNSTVFDNKSSNGVGGGIYHLMGSITIENSIIAGNNDNGTAPNLRPDPSNTPDVTFSLIDDSTGTSLTSSSTADANGNLIGSPGSPLDPILGPLADNGGPTQTHALLPGSPAIDAGGPSPPLVNDQRGTGVPRVFDDPVAPGSGIDIGAFELQPPAVEIVSPDQTIFEPQEDTEGDLLPFIAEVDVQLSFPVSIEPGILLNYDVSTSGDAVLGEDFFISQVDLSTTDGVPPTNAIFIPQGADSATFSVAALPDAIDEGLGTINITLRASDPNSDAFLIAPRNGHLLSDGVTTTITLQDNGAFTAELITTNAFGEVGTNFYVDASGVGTVDVQLGSQPTGNVTLQASCDCVDSSDGSTLLTFTPDNWDQPQALRIAGQTSNEDGVPDALDSISISVLGAEDSNYEFLPSIDLILFDEPEDVLLQTTEGGAPQVVTPTVSIQPVADALEGNIQPGTFVVTSDLLAPAGGLRVFYNITQGAGALGNQFTIVNDPGPGQRFVDIPAGELSTAILIETVDDLVADGSITVGVDLAASTTYDLDSASATLDVVDNDIASIETATLAFAGSPPQLVATPFDGETLITTSENGGEFAFGLRLTSQPTLPVTVTVNSQDTTEGLIDETFTFTPENWNDYQQANVIAVDDSLVDGEVIYVISVEAPTYSVPANFSITNEDNDTEVDSPIVINNNSEIIATIVPTEGSISESSAQGQFEIRLSEPAPATGLLVNYVVVPESADGSDINLPSLFELTGNRNPFDSSRVAGFDAGEFVRSFALGDVDNDGDQDALIVYADNSSQYFENIGSRVVPEFVLNSAENPLSGSTELALSADLGDLDNDGDLDAIQLSTDGTLQFFENQLIDTGSLGFAELTGIDNPLNNVFIDLQDVTDVTLVDLDDDGLLELLTTSDSDASRLFGRLDTNSPYALRLDNPVAELATGIINLPEFVDFDDDGDLDIFVGGESFNGDFDRNGDVTGNDFLLWQRRVSSADANFDGQIDQIDLGIWSANIPRPNERPLLRFIENVGTSTNANFVERFAFDNPGVLEIDQTADVAISTPAFADINDDGFFDLFVPQFVGEAGTVRFFDGGRFQEAFIPVGQTSLIVDIPLVDDQIDEANETFRVALIGRPAQSQRAVVNGSVTTGNTTVTIDVTSTFVDDRVGLQIANASLDSFVLEAGTVLNFASGAQLTVTARTLVDRFQEALVPVSLSAGASINVGEELSFSVTTGIVPLIVDAPDATLALGDTAADVLGLSAGTELHFSDGSRFVVTTPQLLEGGNQLFGDYDSDNAVQGSDFLTWQRGFGSSDAPADGNRDGIVNSTDLDLWSQNFGRQSLSGDALPAGTAVSGYFVSGSSVSNGATAEIGDIGYRTGANLAVTGAFDGSAVGLQISESAFTSFTLPAGLLLIFDSGTAATVVADTLVSNSTSVSVPVALVPDTGAQIPAGATTTTGEFTIGADDRRVSSAQLVIEDNDEAGVRVIVSGTTTSEAGESQTLNLSLETQPTEIVLVNVGVQGQEATLSSGDQIDQSFVQLTFTPTDWDVPQTVTVTGVDDDLVDGDASYRILTTIVSADLEYADNVVSIVPTADIDLSSGTGELTIEELTIPEINLPIGATLNFTNGATFTVTESNATLTNASGSSLTGVLTSPNRIVVNDRATVGSSDLLVTTALDLTTGAIGLQIDDATVPQLTLPAGTVLDFDNGVRATFTSQATFTNSDETIANLTVDLNLITTLATAQFQQQLVPDLEFTNIDDDAIGVTLIRTDQAAAFAEGASNNFFSVVLNSEPTADVQITLSPLDENGLPSDNIRLAQEVQGEPLTITFTPENWNITQSIEVTAVDDERIEYDHVALVTASVASNDSAYDEFAVPNEIRVFIEDNDLPTASVRTVAGAIESNAPGFFVITLDTPVPASAGETGIVVTYSISGTADADGIGTQTDDLLPITGTARIAPGESQSPLIAFPIDDFQAEGVDLILPSGYSSSSSTIELQLDVDPFEVGPDDNASDGTVDLRFASVAGATTILSQGTTLLLGGNTTATVNETVIIEETGFTSVSVSLNGSNSDVVTGDTAFQEIPIPAGTALEFPGGAIVTTTQQNAFITNRAATPIAASPAEGTTLDLPADSTTKLQGESVVVTLDAPNTEARYQIDPQSDTNSAALTIVDNDRPGIRVVSPLSTPLTFEGGANGQLFISLLSQPVADVTITIDDILTSRKLTVDQSYDSSSSSIGIRVNDAGVNSLLLEANQQLEFGSTVATVLEDTTIFFADATGNAQFVQVPVLLDGNIAADATADFEYEELTFAGGSNSLTFNSNNWFELQAVDIVGVDDNVVENSQSANVDFHSSEITFTVDSLDPTYSVFEVANEAVNIVDRSFDVEQTTVSLMQGFLALQDSINNLELPIVGNFGDVAPSFIEEFLEGLAAELRAQDNLTSENLEAAFNVAIDNALSVEQLTFEVTGIAADELSFQLTIQDTFTDAVSLSNNFGLEALNIEIESMGTVDLTAGYTVALAFGISAAEGLFIDTNDTLFQVDASLSLSEDFAAVGSLGFIQLDIDNGAEGTALNAQFDVTLNDSGPADGRLTLSDIVDARNDPLNFINYAFTGAAVLDLDLITSVSGFDSFPSFGFNLHSDLPLFNYGNEAEASSSDNAFDLQFREITLDLGGFVTGLLAPVITTVNDVVEPFRPIIDVLNTELEFLGAIGLVDTFDENGDGRATLIEVASSLASGTSTRSFSLFADAILGIIEVADSLSELQASIDAGENLAINFGDYTLGGFNGASSETDAEQIDPAATGTNNLNQNTSNQTMNSGNNLISTFFGRLDNLGITLDVIENPLNVIRLFLGQDIDLVTWDVPELDLGFSFERSFGIFPPFGLFGVIGGGFSIQSDLTFGFDTFGFRQWQERDFAIEDAHLVFDGFFLSDIDPDTGEDVDELTLQATIEAGAELTAVVASVTLSGGIEGTAGLDIVDVGEYEGESDGRIRASEILPRLSTPLELFELAGQIDVFFNLAVSVGLDLGFFEITTTVVDIEFARFTLFEFALGGGGGGTGDVVASASSTSEVEAASPASMPQVDVITNLAAFEATSAPSAPSSAVPTREQVLFVSEGYDQEPEKATVTFSEISTGISALVEPNDSSGLQAAGEIEINADTLDFYEQITESHSTNGSDLTALLPQQTNFLEAERTDDSRNRALQDWYLQYENYRINQPIQNFARSGYQIELETLDTILHSQAGEDENAIEESDAFFETLGGQEL